MSLIAWLDSSAHDERLMRELVHRFTEPGTLDELGLGRIRDALSDTLFPGSSTQHTRARYFLFLPWIYHDAARNNSGTELLAKAQQAERRLILAMKTAGATEGLIGRAGGQTLPSQLYWTALRRYRILRVASAPNQLHQIGSVTGHSGIDEEALPAEWAISIGGPADFPKVVENGFDLTHDEAEWLRDRIVTSTRGSYLSVLLTDATPLPAPAASPWQHPALADAPEPVQDTVEHARLFSLVMNGAGLLYNLLVAELYEGADLHAVNEPIARYRERLDGWSARITDQSKSIVDWDVGGFWDTVNSARTTPITGAVRTFVDDWVTAMKDTGADGASDDNTLRGLVADRERYNKNQHSRLRNPRLVASWNGASGSEPFDFRWPQVSRIVADIVQGLTDDAGA
ncbi:DUF6361 family protein [Gordonia sp. VNK1]|uniref:DUF6361 family protein n=1 Tax=Gordonia oleivorans TaxID=3156618 RepID=UPI0032B50225